MSSSMNTILVIGGTSGIGEAFARRWHSMGKKVIVTGRRKDRLDGLKESLSGLETYVWDNSDLKSIPSHIGMLFETYDIDTVWVNSGVQFPSSIMDISSTTDDQIVQEVTVNLTAPTLIARHAIPRLLNRSTEATFMITSSGMAYVPNGAFPVYCPTKAAIHAYLVGIRQKLQDTNVHVLEIVPPAVYTDFADFSNIPGTMQLEDFTDQIFERLDRGEAKSLKEVAAGSAVGRLEAWRSSIGALLEEMKLGG